MVDLGSPRETGSFAGTPAGSGRLRLVLLGIGAAFLALVVWQAGPRAVAERLAAIGPRWPLILLPSGLAVLVDTLAWRYAFSPGVSVGLRALLRARLAGEAINTLTPAAYVGGEPLKAYLLAPAVPLAEGLSAAIVSRTLMTLAHVAFVAVGLAAALGRFHGARALLPVSLALVLLAAAGLWWLVVRQQRGFVGSLVALAARLGIRPAWLRAQAAAIADLDGRIAGVYRDARGRLGLSLALGFLGWLLGTGETYLALALMGLPIDLPTALALEALASMGKAATFIIPASLGGQEGVHALLFTGFGYPLAAAVGYSVVRRVREMLWAGLGLACLARGRSARPDGGLGSPVASRLPVRSARRPAAPGTP